MRCFYRFFFSSCCLIMVLAVRGQSTSSENQIRSLMDSAAQDWNRGNLEGYMSLYDPHATMMLPTGRVGLDSMRNLYLKYYFKDGKPKQQLSYDTYQFTPLGRKYALLTGRFLLKPTDKLPQRIGSFSLIFVHRKQGWKLLHDHSG
jgi:hypothetical protein